PFLHDAYWTWMLVFLLLAAGAVVTLVRAGRRRRAAPGGATAGPAAAWPELDAAWDEIIVRLEQAKIDPSAQRVYLLLAPDEEQAAAVVHSAGVAVFVEAPDAPA